MKTHADLAEHVAAEVFGVTLTEMRSHKRTRVLADARKVCWFLLERDVQLNLVGISHRFHVTRSAVGYGISGLASLVTVDPELNAKLSLARKLFWQRIY